MAISSAMASVAIFLSFFLFTIPPSSPAPILAPLLSHCHAPSDLLPKDASLNCCPPSWPGLPLQFQFHDYPQSHLRVRPAAHLVDPSYAHKLNLAYRLMKDLPPEDPRSFSQQTNVHCAWCNQIYNQVNSSLPIQVHHSWLFFPFHRWYLYFHERILGALLEDDTFALPFWNYDSPEGSTIPRIYLEYKDLFDPRRNAAAQPPAIVPIDYAQNNNASNRPRDEQLAVNAALMYRNIVSGTPTPSLFYGEPYRAGDEPMPGQGAVETTAHNSVHWWVGDPESDIRKDMGLFYSSGLDPVFYAHHASLDRMWELWKSKEGHEDFDDPDFLDSEFIFYNERAELVKVTVRDSLDARKLGFTYAEVENAWMNARPSALSKGPIETVPETLAACSLIIESPCIVKVERNKVEAVQGREEVLVMEGIEVMRDRATHFNVFVNLPTADASTIPNCTEFAGSFLNIPQMLRGAAMHHHPATKLRLSISFIVQELNLAAADSLFVTIVPLHDPPFFSPIAFSSMKIEYESVLYRRITASS